MTRRLAVIALLAGTAGLVSCDRPSSTEDQSTPEARVAGSGATAAGPGAGNASADGATGLSAGESGASSTDRSEALASASVVGTGTAIEGAPAFAVIFPGATVEPTPLLTSTPGGAGGGIVFTSSASPDDIVRFYRQGADEAGMTQVMALNTGDTRAYSATKGPGGASLTIVAHPVDEGQTSAQLTWTVGP